MSSTHAFPSCPALCRLSLLLACAMSLQAFDRLNLLVDHVPVPVPARPGAPASLRLHQMAKPRVAVSGDAIWFTSEELHAVYLLKNGTITTFSGTGLTFPQALLAMRDQSILVGGLGRVLHVNPQPASGQPQVRVYASTRPGDDRSLPASPPDAYGPISGMLELQDGSVLLIDLRSGRILQTRGDRLDLFCEAPRSKPPSRGPAAAEASPGQPTGLAQLGTGSILVCDPWADQVLRIHPGKTSLFAGKGAQAEHPVVLDTPIRLGVMPDGSVLILQTREGDGEATDPGGQLLRVSSGSVQLLAGHDDGRHPHAPQYLAGVNLAGANDLAVLPDGSVVLATLRGLLLLSPPDLLQKTLETLVEQGKAGIQRGQPGELQAAERTLWALAGARRPDPKAPVPAGPDSAELKQQAPLAMLIGQDVAHNPALRLRAQLALKELQTFAARKQPLPPNPPPRDPAEEKIPAAPKGEDSSIP